MIAIDRIAAAADEHVLAGQSHRVDGIDAAADANGAVRRDRHRPREQFADSALVDLPARTDHAVDEFARWRRHGEAANVHHAGSADYEPVRVGEVDVAADAAVL